MKSSKLPSLNCYERIPNDNIREEKVRTKGRKKISKTRDERMTLFFGFDFLTENKKFWLIGLSVKCQKAALHLSGNLQVDICIS